MSVTLDELIAALQLLRERCPAAGVAYVNGVHDVDEILYERGEVWVTSDDDIDFEGLA